MTEKCKSEFSFLLNAMMNVPYDGDDEYSYK